MNTTLETYCEVLPHIKDYLGQDIMIGLTDGSKFVGFWQGEKMRAPVQIGDALKSDDPMIESFKKGKVIDVILPPHIHGFPFRSITAPVRDKSGKIVGTIGIGSSLELLYSVEQIVGEIQQKLNSAEERFETFNDTSKKVSDQADIILSFMNEISEKSVQIEKAAKEISNISVQTGLLAINASIEAAHAGTVGKGFSIVAQEMKKLSTSTHEASETIFSLIKGLSTSASQNYDALHGIQEMIVNQQVSAGELSEEIRDARQHSNAVVDIMHNQS